MQRCNYVSKLLKLSQYLAISLNEPPYNWNTRCSNEVHEKNVTLTNSAVVERNQTMRTRSIFGQIALFFLQQTGTFVSFLDKYFHKEVELYSTGTNLITQFTVFRYSHQSGHSPSSCCKAMMAGRLLLRSSGAIRNNDRHQRD